ncbi:DUF4365 domain-containing protein [Lysinibacillus sp. UGB7]|uniref:DUF4365 domain-containing protein n=1 Tax=Lysinibacillus sp. UGB7 TaxID=3411039 RepID=UPI003B7B3973
MASFSNSQLEKIAVNAVTTAALLYPLNSNIPVGDKGISFDGDIEVMKDTSETKDAFLGKVPVQVKGTEVKKFSGRTRKFSLEIAHLSNYYKTNGAVLFVVEIDRSGNPKVFYKHLLPYEIKMILKAYGQQKKRVIILRELNETTIYKVCTRFLTEANRQSKNLIDNNPFTKESFTSFKMTSVTFNPETDNITEHDFTFYGVVGDLYVPIGIGRLEEEIIEGMDTLIIDGFETIEAAVEFKINKDKETVTVTIEKSLEIKIESLKYFKFNIKKFISIEKQLRVLPILIAFLSGKEIKFKDTGTTFVGGNVYDETILPKIKELHQDFLNLKEAFTIMKMDLKTEFINETGNLHNNIKILVDLIVNKDLSKINRDSLGNELFSGYDLGGLKLLLFLQLRPSPQYMNAFSEEILSKNPLLEVRDKNNKLIKKCPTSPYVSMKTEDLVQIANIDFPTIKRSFDRIKPIMEKETFNYINSFCLNCIGAFDETNRNDFLDLAEYIYSLHKSGLSEFEEEIIRINQLQINFRKNGGLSGSESRELITMKQKTQNEEVLFCTSVLLSSTIEATTFFEGFPHESKEKYKIYPIYNLYKKQKS